MSSNTSPAAALPAQLHCSEATEQLLTGAKLMAVPVQQISLPDQPAAPIVDVVKLPKVVREYPLPGARETHEMAVVGTDMLVVTQQSNSTLVKVQLCQASGRPVSCSRFLISDFWDGLHGLAASHLYPAQVWATLQFKSLIIRINPGVDMASLPIVEQVINLPSSVYGPHCICECGEDLWITCKDSCHVVRINNKNPDDYSVYPCSRRPIFMAKHPTSKDVYASLDLSSKIWRLVPSTGSIVEIDIPSSQGTTPVGLVSGPDDNLWFTLLGGPSGGTGTFGQISPSGEIKFFSLTTTVGAKAGLIHLAFDWDHHLKQQEEVQPNEHNGNANVSTPNIHRMWLLSSSLVATEGNGIDAVFSAVVDSDLGRIITQHSICLPTQHCASHRILPHRTGIFVSQLNISSLAYITGAAALHPPDVVGETTDMYSDFGHGQRSSNYVFSKECVSRVALLSPAVSSSSTTNSDQEEVVNLKPLTRRGAKRPRPQLDASDMQLL